MQEQVSIHVLSKTRTEKEHWGYADEVAGVVALWSTPFIPNTFTEDHMDPKFKNF